MIYSDRTTTNIIEQIAYTEKEISYVSGCLNTAQQVGNKYAIICLVTRLERYTNKLNLLKIKLA